MPKSYDSALHDWYPPGHGDVFESLYNSGILDKLIQRGIEIIFLSNADNLGAVVDLRILQHMVETDAEYIMELTNKTKADVKGGTIIDYEGSVRLLEIAAGAQGARQRVQVDQEVQVLQHQQHLDERQGHQARRRERRARDGDHPQRQDHPRRQEGRVRHLHPPARNGRRCRHPATSATPHGVNVPRRRFLPVKTCSDLMLVKSGSVHARSTACLQMSTQPVRRRAPDQARCDFKKVLDFQKRIPSIPKIIELDHLTITGAVNLGRGADPQGHCHHRCHRGQTIDIPPGSILENVGRAGKLASAGLSRGGRECKEEKKMKHKETRLSF